MNKLIKLVSITLLTCAFTFGYGQTPPTKMKMGKVSQELVEMTTFESDTSAVAVVIGDFGELMFDGGNSFYRSNFKQHIRIKILKKEGLKYADVLLDYYENDGLRESISSIKGYVYNMKGGSVEKIKLTKDNIYDQKLSENKKVKKVSFSNVKVGSVIEYSYIKKSDFIFSLDPWIAQRDIPTLVSDFKFTVPEYLVYSVNNSRYYSLKELKSSNSTATFTFLDTKQSFTESTSTRHWREENIPAFKKEPFMTSPKDYIARIEMELSATERGIKPVSTTWSSAMVKLRQSSSCGGMLTKTAFMKEELDAIKARTSDLNERAFLVYEVVRKRMTWNKKLGLYADDGGTRKAYMNRKGNVADINLMLIAGLKEVGVSAYPFFGSIRSEGKIVRSSPSLAQLNYVMAFVLDGDNSYLLDATEKNYPFKVLPTRDLNYQGVLMSQNDKVNGQFMNISPAVKDEVHETLVVDIDNDLNVTGTYKGKHLGYDAISWRRKYNSFESEDEYLENYEEKNPGLLIGEYKVENNNNIYEEPVEVFDFELENGVEKAGDAIIINPLKYLSVIENPFKLEKRRYPVEFPYAYRTKFTIQVKIPEGYTVKDLKKPVSMSLIDKRSGGVKYIASYQGNVVTLMVDLKVNRLVYVPEEYTSLKGFFDEAYELQNTSIVLVKEQVK